MHISLGIQRYRVLLSWFNWSFLLYSTHLVDSTILIRIFDPTQHLVNRRLLTRILNRLQIKYRFICITWFIFISIVILPLIIIFTLKYSLAGIIQNIIFLSCCTTSSFLIHNIQLFMSATTTINISIQFVELSCETIRRYVTRLQFLLISVGWITLLWLIEVHSWLWFYRSVN